ITSTITVRRIISGIGVERIFPLHSPTIEKIEILKRGRVRRAKLYYLREAKGKKTKLKVEGGTK
ncbi:50S ribosomal protein L19, partial [bacterium (Candidatus Gribaldobacteria) CG08_land_8_20_14_0_20_39_15]